MVKRLQVVAQVVGIVVIGLLVFSGVVSLFNGTNPVMAALGLRAPQAPQAPQAMEPSIVSYQGMLYDDLGAPLSGEYDLTFRLYDDPIAPVTQTLWTESIPGVTVRDGRFSVLLGDTSPIDAGDFAHADTYIGIQVEAYDELVPRQRFVSVPYAFYATRASGLAAPDGDPLNAVTVDNDGKVGIGTANPTQKLDVDNGNLLVQGTGSFDEPEEEALVYLGDTNHFIKSHYGSGVTIGTLEVPNGIVLEQNTGNVAVSGNMAVGGNATVNGDAGIGTINPTQKLDVDNGNLLVQGIDSFDATGEEALVYLGDTAHFIKSEYEKGVTIGTYQVPNGIFLEESTGDVTVTGAMSWADSTMSYMVKYLHGIEDGGPASQDLGEWDLCAVLSYSVTGVDDYGGDSGYCRISFDASTDDDWGDVPTKTFQRHDQPNWYLQVEANGDVDDVKCEAICVNFGH